MAERVIVVGTGTMGAGIAALAAASGYEVVAVDRQEVLAAAGDRVRQILGGEAAKGRLSEAVRQEALGRIHTAPSFDDALPAKVLIEAVPEAAELKAEVFRRVGEGAVEILATNTSSLSVSRLAREARDPASFIGIHFFNPPVRMQLVEIVPGEGTSEGTVAAAAAFVKSLSRTPVIAADTPGFIVNRVARPFYIEALRMLGDGTASPEAIDRCLEGRGFRMGPFRLMDLVGIDVNLAVSTSVYDQLMQEPRLRPHPIQRRMVEAGRLGRKTGRGFYTYG